MIQTTIVCDQCGETCSSETFGTHYLQLTSIWDAQNAKWIANPPMINGQFCSLRCLGEWANKAPRGDR